MSMKKRLGFDKHLEGMALQDYLSLGYLFLILLGLLDNLIYFETLGINILNYTSISDILITPLSTVFGNYKITFFIIVALIVFYYITKYMIKAIMERGRKMAESKNEEFKEVAFEPFTAIIYLFVCLFLGINLGSTRKVKSNIESGNFTANKTIILNDNTQKDVYIVGHNSTYLFFVEKNSKDIQVMPISGNVKMMKNIRR
jgi:hypothetical protein